ncbi:MAG TPA: hypothetical protein GX696_09605 [Pseudomonadaceae bacterium]|nr:hypothetical protein [Pseudomonadaceae bacterium]
MRFLLTAVMLFLLGTAWASWSLLDTAPSVINEEQMRPADLRRAHQFLSENLDTGRSSSIELSESDLGVLVSGLLEQLHGGAARFSLSPSQLQVQLSAGLPAAFPGNWLNVDLQLAQTDGLPQVEQLLIGGLNVPVELANPLLDLLHAELDARYPDYSRLLSTVQSYAFKEDQLQLVYAFEADTLALLSSTGRDLLVDPRLSEGLLYYSDRVVALSAEQEGPRASLMSILPALMELAHARGGDPVEENRAAIIALTLYQFDIDALRLLSGDISPAPRARGVRYNLFGRYDIAEHFLGSAALTISTDAALAESLGLQKELDDSGVGGSGFSFVDLSADRTGIRFAELAVANTSSARQMQDLLRSNSEESFLMPDFRDLPEFYDNETFQEAYGDMESAAYLSRMEEIERRLDSTPLFQGLR